MLPTMTSRPLVVIGLGVVFLGLGAVTSRSAPEPKVTDTLKGHTAQVTSVAYSPDGKTLASGSLDHTLRLWELASGKNTATLRGHEAGLGCIAYSPDGKTLASGCTYETIKLWDPVSGKELAALKGEAGAI